MSVHRVIEDQYLRHFLLLMDVSHLPAPTATTSHNYCRRSSQFLCFSSFPISTSDAGCHTLLSAIVPPDLTEKQAKWTSEAFIEPWPGGLVTSRLTLRLTTNRTGQTLHICINARLRGSSHGTWGVSRLY
ncbi:protein of unknown function [Burkholderia multivorans]